MLLYTVFKNFWQNVCGLIYPHQCLRCKKDLLSQSKKSCLCQACQEAISFNRPPFCSNCSRFLNGAVGKTLCPECEKNHYHFDRTWGTTIYNETMKELLHLFKYCNKTALQYPFSKLICSFLENYGVDLKPFDWVVPVPLHSTRLRERGFNQSELLASHISSHYQIPLLNKNLQRLRHTPNQARLKKKERWTNIRGAFKIVNSSLFKNSSVVLVDDLFTTGATVSEAARTLKEAGARRVEIVTLAIAYLEDL